MKNILEGMKVLDLTRVLAGPYATMILADLGAEVIKVELPQFGDEARFFGPFQNGESAYFSSVNRGKKSITIDLRMPEGSNIVRSLLKDCDVVVENFRPGSMNRFGLVMINFPTVILNWFMLLSLVLVRLVRMPSAQRTM